MNNTLTLFLLGLICAGIIGGLTFFVFQVTHTTVLSANSVIFMLSVFTFFYVLSDERI